MKSLLQKAKDEAPLQGNTDTFVYTKEQLELIFAMMRGEVHVSIGMKILNQNDPIKFLTSKGYGWRLVQNHALQQGIKEGYIVFKM